MKKLINLRIGALLFMLMALSVTSAYADVTDFEISVRNVTQTASDVLEFDIYLLDTDAGQTFEFGGLQLGLLLNSAIYGTGSLTVTIDNGDSELDSDQQFVNDPDVVTSLSGYSGQTLIRLAANSIPPYPPGAGTGTVISTTGDGTILTHFVITSTEDFAINSTADLAFCASAAVSPLFPTIVYEYIDGNRTALTVTPGTNAFVDGNPLLNATLPSVFDVTGGGSYCTGGAGLPVGLSDSETGVTYTLLRNTTEEVTTIDGTGSALSFGDQTEGTYTITGTNAAGTVSMYGQATITSYTNTVSAASSTPTVCINTVMTSITHTTTGATGIGTATGLPSGVTASFASNTITISGTPTASGTFDYIIPLTGGCGSVSATGTITVTPANTVSAASSTPTVCINTVMTSITHTTTGATGIGTATGLPSGVTASFASNTITISGTPTASGTFGYTIPLTGGCESVSATGTITVTPANTVSAASSTPTVCINTVVPAITHTTTGATGIGTATGLPAGVTAGWASNTITVSGTPTASGIFDYTIPLTGGCGSVSATGTITVTPANTVSAASSTPTVCINTVMTSITHTTTGATGIGTATGLPSGVTASFASNTITISGTPTASGSFGYTIPLTGGCGSVSATGTITVTPANTITLTSGAGSNNQTVCVNSAITTVTYSTSGATGATVTGLPTGLTGTWSSNVVTISGTPASAGTSNYTVTLTGGCGTVTATGTITVNALPTTSTISGSTTPACSGTGYVYSVTTTAGSDYAWTVPEGATIASGQGSHSITVNFGTTNGNITVTETNSSDCIGTPRTLAISLQGCGLDANFEGTPESICIGSTVTFTNTSTGTSESTGYSWNFGAGASPATANTEGPHIVTYTTSGSKTVSLTITEGASNIETKTNYITVNPINTITLTSAAGTNNQTVCINTPVTTITYGTTSATGATFSNFPTGLSVGWSSNVITISGSPTASGTFNYTIELTGGCGTVSTTGTITVTPANTITLTSGAGSNNQTVCSNSAVTNITYSTTGATGATVTGLPAGCTGTWSSNVVTISGTPMAAGTSNYTVTLTGGCGAVTANGTITVNAVPATSEISGSTTPACSGTGYVYSVTNTAGSSYAWTVPEGATIASGQGSHSITVNFGTTNGNITVTETNSSDCTGTTRTLTISLQGCGLDANFTATPLEICAGSTVTFTNTSTGTSESTGYSWNFGAGASPATANTEGPHIVTYTTSGSKTVSLTITEGASNIETKTNYITVNATNTIILTSAAGTNNQTVCMNLPITSITYGTTGATGADVTGLPSGVTGSWSSNVVTISGTPNESGTFNYTVTLTGGCGTITAAGTLTVNICSRTLNLSSVFLEGLYSGGGSMNQAWGETGTQWPAGIADHVTVELHNAADYWTIAYTASDVELTTGGAAVVTIPVEYSGSYYVTVKHRNSIETTTAAALSFSGSTINYTFNSLASVYGGNMALSGDGRYLIFAGDVNQDGFIDTQDYIGIDNDSYNYAYGYLVTDIDGNGMVDTNDYIPIDNNNYNYIGAILP